MVVSNICLFSPLPGEMIQFDEHIFQMGWNHQLDIVCSLETVRIEDPGVNKRQSMISINPWWDLKAQAVIVHSCYCLATFEKIPTTRISGHLLLMFSLFHIETSPVGAGPKGCNFCAAKGPDLDMSNSVMLCIQMGVRTRVVNAWKGIPSLKLT